MTVHRVDPHLSASGGCRCDCLACMGVRRPRVPGGLFQRVCICPECSQDCGSIRGAGPTELGAIEPHSVSEWPPRVHCGCRPQRDGFGCCWCGRRSADPDEPGPCLAGTPTEAPNIVQSPSKLLTPGPAYALPTHSPVQAVVRAWTAYGPRPDVHRAAMAQLRRDWPVLAGALDRLAGAPPEDPRVLLRATPGSCRACEALTDVCRYGFCIRCHNYDCERSSLVDGPHRTHFIAERKGHKL